MENTRKMVLVPQETLRNLQTTQPTVKEKQINALDEQIRTVLERDDLDLHGKAQLYSQYLRQYLHATDSLKQPLSIELKNAPYSPSTPTSDTPPILKEENTVERDILQHVPKLYVKRATQLLEKMKQHGDIGWTGSGELLLRGQRMMGTNMCDLVYDLFRERRGYTPSGSEHFIRGLANINLPETIVSNPQRRSELQRLKRMRIESTSSTASPGVSLTPQSKPLNSKSKRKKKGRETSPRSPEWFPF